MTPPWETSQWEQPSTWETSSWETRWRYVAGLAVCAVLGWFAFVREVNVPILSGADFGVHELGHLLTYVFPDVVTAMMGSVFQVAVPWALAAYFIVGRRDPFGGVVCLAWAATSAQNASVYIADAPWQLLPLVGGEHDWAFVLGRFGAIDRAEQIAAVVKGAGMVMLLSAACMCVAGLAFPYLKRRDAPKLIGSAETLP